jgi:hypothetical protein
MNRRMVDTLIVGGGPAATAVLLAAARCGALGELARAGLAIAEAGPRLGAGALSRYDIHSDSTARTFLAGVAGHPDALVAAVADGDAGRAIAALPADGSVHLKLVASFLDALGAALDASARAAGAHVMTGHRVVTLRREQFFWVACLQAEGCAPLTVVARQVVIATGGVQSPAQAEAVPTVAGKLGPLCGSRLMLSDTLLADGGIAALSAQLAGVTRPRVTVLGGSTSALAAARLVLDSDVGARMAAGALALVHRRQLRPFYRSAQAALADGFSDFGAHDICPVSGFVYRLGGARLAARELVLHALKIGGRRPDRRLRLVRPAASERGLRALEDAHVVVAATGYRPRGLPVTSESGAPIRLHADGPGAAHMVDGACRVLDEAGVPLPGLFGIGLAAGFVPHGPLGGEASFAGQANGLWLWQNDIGDLIVRQLRENASVTNREVA